MNPPDPDVLAHLENDPRLDQPADNRGHVCCDHCQDHHDERERP